MKVSHKLGADRPHVKKISEKRLAKQLGLLSLAIMLGSTLALSSDLRRVQAQTLGEALDNPSLTWSTGGSAFWYGQTTTYYYGGDAAQSGAIADSQTSWLSTTVSGMKYLRFRWKVSSQSGHDFLSFYMDYELMEQISGEVNWQEKAYYIPTGSHTFEWRYTKDGGGSAGSDAGWVDQVEVVYSVGMSIGEAVDNTALTWQGSAANAWFGENIISTYGGDAAQSGYIYNSESTYIETSVTGPGTVAFYWKVSCESADGLTFYIDGSSQGGISGNVDWQYQSYTVTGGLHILRWTFSHDVSLTEGQDAGWVDRVTFNPTTISIAEAVDYTAVAWTSSGDEMWYGLTTTYYYGGDAAQSGVAGIDNGYSLLRTSVTGPGTASFYWMVSSEQGFDFLQFYVDGVLKDSISGEVGWQQKSYVLGSGSRLLEWKYSKDDRVDSGIDAGWVDRFQFIGSAAQVATPTFSPPGGTYSSSQSVTITCSTSAATIRYTTDGSEPTASSPAYSTLIGVSSTTTIKAKAFKTGLTASDTASATYTINIPSEKVATPTFSPPGGTYSNGQSVTITCSTSGATIRYTLDGSEPTSSSTTYSGPISVSSTTTIKAKAFKSGMTESATASATYTINIPGDMWELTLGLVGSGSTTPAQGVYSYANGTEVPVEATPSTKWVFDHWVLDGTVTVTMNPVSITMGRDRDVVAVFIRVPPTAESCDITGAGKNQFNSSETIYVSGIGYGQQAGVDLYVVRDVTWTDGLTIPARVAGTATNVVSDMSGEILPMVVWTKPLAEGKYDICVDVNSNGRYDEGVDALDDNEVEVSAGFAAPELPSLLALLMLLVLATPIVGFTRTRTARRSFR